MLSLVACCHVELPTTTSRSLRMIKDQENVAPLISKHSSTEKPWKQKRKPAQTVKEVEIFEGKPVVPSPSLVELTPVEDGYIKIICMHESAFLVPRKVVDSFKCIDVILYSEVSFKERLENAIRFPDMSSQVMETVLRFVFTDHLNKLKAERYWGCETPRLVFQFEVTPNQAMDLIHAAHFLGVENLLNVAATMVAHNLQDVQDLSSLPPDLGWCIAEQLSVEDLFLAEERSDFLALNLDTEILWKKHCDNYCQEDIVPVSQSSAYPPYDAWEVTLGPPPTSWKSLCITEYLQQLADRQNGGDTERFLLEVSEKGQHVYSLLVHPVFWEWVIQGDTKLFVSYLSFFKNLLKLTLSALPLGKRSKDGTLPSSQLGCLLQSLPVLEFLDISDGGIGAEAAVALSSGLKEHKSLQILRLPYNNIETWGFSAIVQALPSVRTLKVFDVCDNGISAWVDWSVVEALQDAALEELVLEGNFKFICKPALFPMQPPPPPTSNSSNELNVLVEPSDVESSMKDLVMSGLPKGLKFLQYARCELNDIRTKVLVKSLTFLSRIQKLDLSGNKITSEGATSIFLWLQENGTLKELNLSNNYVTDSCSATLSRVISNHLSLEKLSLMENYSYGESNLNEVLTAAMERGMMIQPKNFTILLRFASITQGIRRLLKG
ncbi:hypothetical protein GOP47_0012427 [Adiantum capillus-veneris]|uniref:Uncharacterized protein n=1 Tax=Adiantum capillus-veneris TaxID=13818 RepID=A0A9D4UQW6_ADICA|nr:hypothetical protein GOP47_0012427 [Adiantum capillus-veneris]